MAEPYLTNLQSIFERTPRPGGLAMSVLRAGFLFRGLHDPDAGLVCYVARRRP